MTVVKKTAVPGNVEPDLKRHGIIVKYQIRTVYSDKKVKKENAEKFYQLSDFSSEDIQDVANDLLSQVKLISKENKQNLILALTSLCEGHIVDSIQGQADINELKNYLDKLYDDMPQKIQATHQIAELCQNKEYLQIIASNDTVISALAKCLTIDGLRSIELGTNISQIFYLISHYAEYGYTLLAHNVQDSLFRMIEQENKRYQQIYDDVAKIRQNCQNPNSGSNAKAKFQKAYEQFKQLIATQDKMLFTALQTVKNLTEIKESNSDEIDLLIPASDLCQILDQVLQRKPVNIQLAQAVIGYFNKVSMLSGGNDFLRETKIVQSISHIIGKDADLDDEISTLTYNMLFDEHLLHKILEVNISKIIDSQLNSINSDVLQLYSSDYSQNDDFLTQVKKCVKNHEIHKFNGKIISLQDKFQKLANFAVKISQNNQIFESFSETNISTNILLFIILTPNVTQELLQAATLFLQVVKLASKTVKTGLTVFITQLFSMTKKPAYIQLYTLLAAAVPQQSTDKNFYETGANIISAAIDTQDPNLIKTALQTAAQTPVDYIQPEQVSQLVKLALSCLNNKNCEKADILASIGVIQMQMSRAGSVQQMLDRGELTGLAQLIINVLEQEIGSNLIDKGVIVSNIEYDMIIMLLVTILKASTYKLIRKDFLQINGFLQLIVRFLYNVERQDCDDCVVKNQSKSGSKKEDKQQNQIVLQSNMDSVEKRALNLFDALASLILEVFYFAEPEVTENIKLLKFQRYNWSYFKKYLQ